MSYKKIRKAATIEYVASGTGATVSTVESKLDRSLDITDFGAVGDGVTDDTAAIQACFDAAVQGTVITFPGGRYKITSVLTLNKNGITLRGIGTFASNAVSLPTYGKASALDLRGDTDGILINGVTGTTPNIPTSTSATPTTTTSYTTTTTATVGAANISIEGLDFYGRSDTHSGTALDTPIGNTALDVHIKNCSFFGCGTAIKTGLSYLIKNCQFESNGTAIDAQSALNLLILENDFHRNTNCIALNYTNASGYTRIANNVLDAVGGKGASLIDTSGATSPVVDIINNSLGIGTVVIDSDDFVFQGNRLSNLEFLSIGATATNGSFVGNSFFYSLTASFPLIECEGNGINISNNFFYYLTSTFAVELTSFSTNCIVSNNVFKNYTTQAVVLLDAAVDDAGVGNEVISVDTPPPLHMGETGTTATISTEEVMLISSGGVTITLPSAVILGAGALVRVKDTSGNAGADPITVDAPGGQTIDNASTFMLNSNYVSMAFVSNGTDWLTIF